MERISSENPIDILAATAGADWGSLRQARAEAHIIRHELTELVSDLGSREDTSVVVFGSVARGEVTGGSDTDWTLLVDGQASSTHFEVAREIERRLKAADRKGPGREGTFGGLAFSHEILHKIGGGEDTNRNLTQRILLLLESAAVGADEAYGRVVRGVLDRYITEDPGWAAKTVTAPRFLVNDLARYWRTVAVDFAYKRRERAAEGWALRSVKLRLSRKLTYASGLLACFSCALEPSIHEADDRSKAVIHHLLDMVDLTPLERMALLLPQQQLSSSARKLFDSYDAFLALLDDEGARDRLEGLSPDEAARDKDYERAREIGHAFQNALDEIFFDNASPIPALTRKYGVF